MSDKNRFNPSLNPAAPALRYDPEGSPEEWKAIPRFEGLYEVSSIGRVRGVDRIEESQNQHGLFYRRRKGRIKQPWIDPHGRARVTLFRDGRGEKWMVYHLVLLAFVGAPGGEIGLLDGQFSCNHIDGDCTNDFYKNLEWLLNEEHRKHTVANNLHASHESHARAKLTWADVREIRRAYDMGEAGQTGLARRYGVSKGNIDFIVKRKTWIEDKL